jgi:hypothetical protein
MLYFVVAVMFFVGGCAFWKHRMQLKADAKAEVAKL